MSANYIRQKLISDLAEENIYNRPIICPVCQGEVMTFRGCGTYQCKKCGAIAYDDWGKVREYLYSHMNSTASDVERDTGVSRKNINRMLRESKITVSDGAKSILHCELCRKPILTGRLCPQCEISYNEQIEANARMEQAKRLGMTNMQALYNGKTIEDGKMRFQTRHRTF